MGGLKEKEVLNVANRAALIESEEKRENETEDPVCGK